MSKIITSIPRSATTNKYSAMVSSIFSLLGMLVRIEVNEKIHENVSNTGTTDVDSSIKCVSF